MKSGTLAVFGLLAMFMMKGTAGTPAKYLIETADNDDGDDTAAAGEADFAW